MNQSDDAYMRGILEIYSDETEHRKKQMISATSAKRRHQLQLYRDCRHLAGDPSDSAAWKDPALPRLVEFLEEMIDFIEDLEDDEDNSDSFE